MFNSMNNAALAVVTINKMTTTMMSLILLLLIDHELVLGEKRLGIPRPFILRRMLRVVTIEADRENVR